ncbi:MAG: hypothetical protein HZA03_09280 [Nitrospinae bacterium]|nr:hypothetical protein [Nitrospinota bacterium]
MALVIESLQRPIVLNNIPFIIEEERVLRDCPSENGNEQAPFESFMRG